MAGWGSGAWGQTAWGSSLYDIAIVEGASAVDTSTPSQRIQVGVAEQCAGVDRILGEVRYLWTQVVTAQVSGWIPTIIPVSNPWQVIDDTVPNVWQNVITVRSTH